MKFNKLSIKKTIVILCLFSLSLVGFWLWQSTDIVEGIFKSQFAENNTENLTNSQLDSNAKTMNNMRQSSEFVVAGWIPDWGSDAGLDSMKHNGDKLTEISPVWYELGEDGSLISKKPANYLQIITQAKDLGIDVLPTISMFDHELFSTAMSDPENLIKHSKQIATQVENYDYAGFDFNYESTKLVDEAKYFKLLKLTANELKRTDKKFVVTVLAQWDDNFSYKSLRETRRVQNWEKISEFADEIRIMTYDYTVSRSLNPGPIAPIEWMQQVVDFGLERVPANKLVLGIHLYSYEWYMPKAEYEEKLAAGENPLEFQEISDTNIPLNSSPARSYTYSVNKILMSEQENTAIEDYRFGEERVMLYERINPQTNEIEVRRLVTSDKDSVQSRIDLALENGLAGIVFWRLGGNADLLDDIDISRTEL